MAEIIHASRQECEQKAAEIIGTALVRIADEKGSVVFAVPGGRSVSGIFELLSQRHDLPWNQIHIFMIDERLVMPGDPEYNFALVDEHLISKMGVVLPEANVHPFILNESVEGSGVCEYAEELQQFGGRYDVVLLSSGEDGHVGALAPNHHSIKSSQEYYVTMDDSPKPPPKRMSASRNLLSQANVSLVLFFGEAKRTAFENFIDESLDVYACPAKLVNEAQESYALTDFEEGAQ